MRETLEKARRALLTDPVTGRPISAHDRMSLFIGLAQAVPLIIVTIVLVMGMEP